MAATCLFFSCCVFPFFEFDREKIGRLPFLCCLSFLSIGIEASFVGYTLSPNSSKWRQLHLRCVHQRMRRHSAVPPVINQIDKHVKSDQYKAEVAREFNIDIKEVGSGQYEAECA